MERSRTSTRRLERGRAGGAWFPAEPGEQGGQAGGSGGRWARPWTPWTRPGWGSSDRKDKGTGLRILALPCLHCLDPGAKVGVGIAPEGEEAGLVALRLRHVPELPEEARRVLVGRGQ
jgi:hypothetical protein